MMFLSVNNAWTADNYIAVQKEVFLKLNLVFSNYPKWMENLTYFGDALLILSVLSSLLILTPRIFGALLLGSLSSGLLCFVLKWLFSVPRPAAILDTDHFSLGPCNYRIYHTNNCFNSIYAEKQIEEIGMDIGFYHNLHGHFCNAGWGTLHIGCYDRRDYRLRFRCIRYHLQPKIQFMEIDIAKTL